MTPHQRLERAVRRVQADARVPALSVALHRADRSPWTCTVGNSGDPAHPLDPQSRFRIGSVTQTFTATLVMQARDNAITFDPVKRNFGQGYRLITRPDDERPAPAHIEIGHQVATWLAQRTGGIAQSSIFEALGNRPMTAHMLGGAAIGADTETGVVDANLNVFGYQNMIVCDGAALPANPGVNPALTITALAEYSMERVPSAGVNPRRKPRSRELGDYEHD